MSEDKNTMDNNIDNNLKEIELSDHSAIISDTETTDEGNSNEVPETIEGPVEDTLVESDMDTDQIKNNQDKELPAEPQEKASEVVADYSLKKKKFNLYKALRIFFTLGFVVFAGLFVNEVWIDPYRANIAIEKARDLYHRPEATEALALINDPTSTPATTPTTGALTGSNEEVTEAPTPTPDPNRDDKGRLLYFKDLLETNEDVKGWIKINNLVTGENDTKIDYVVMQHPTDPEYYLDKRWYDKKKVKKGSLFLDYKSSVEKDTQNLVIHGHNMTSTDDMFHYLLRYNDTDYYKEHPLITFDTIYQTGEWKIFSVFITNGSSEKEPLFNYTKSNFMNSSDFLNFVYQLRIRSLYNIKDVDINENDQILTLSTCSYEVKNYRTVIVARKVRDGESSSVNVESVERNPKPLYPDSYYYRYGGKAPKLSQSFEIALEDGEINWYNPMGKNSN